VTSKTVQATLRQTRSLLLAIKCDRAALRLRIALQRFIEVAQRTKFNPAQPRIAAGQPGGGRWASDAGSGGDVQTVQARRGSTFPITVGGRTYVTTSQLATELQRAAERAQRALAELAARNPSWRLTPSLSDPNNAVSAINRYRSEAQDAEARLQVITRGNLPLAFNSHEQFREFGRTTFNGLRAAGYSDALPFLRGSSVTGHNFRTGAPFDSVRPSDLDLAIVSPTLMRRAVSEGVPLRAGGRTEALNETQINQLGLRETISRSEAQSGRTVTIMVYESIPSVTIRGPNNPVP
jgi:hypothetical protein